MRQGVLFPEFDFQTESNPKAVNVASVPQRSPFRYPGGKTWFVPTFRKWIVSMITKPKVLVEPFVGGGIISLTALFEKLVDRVVMVEKDRDVAAVWQAVVDGHADWLAQRILDFELTKDNVLKELDKKYKDQKFVAFQTILKNRTFHGGILAEGSSLIKYGENGKGISSRWYPKTLAKRFHYLNLVAARIEFIYGDGIEVMSRHSRKKETIYFIDPPYTAGGKKAGKRLYNCFDMDHDSLFSVCESLRGDFVMTYDLAEEVKQMAHRHHFEIKPIPMTNTHHAEMTELVIGRNLSWMKEASVINEVRPKYRAQKKSR